MCERERDDMVIMGKGVRGVVVEKDINIKFRGLGRRMNFERIGGRERERKGVIRGSGEVEVKILKNIEIEGVRGLGRREIR